jgi:hypothetical protein
MILVPSVVVAFGLLLTALFLLDYETITQARPDHRRDLFFGQSRMSCPRRG